VRNDGADTLAARPQSQVTVTVAPAESRSSFRTLDGATPLDEPPHAGHRYSTTMCVSCFAQCSTARVIRTVREERRTEMRDAGERTRKDLGKTCEVRGARRIV
jgi:hypothetical protein